MSDPGAIDAEAITASFERAAELCEDLTPLVYARLFQDHPELEAHFWREPRRHIRGEMLARTIEAIFDFIGERRYADILIRSEAITHAGYDVPPDAFRLFFGVIRDSVRALLQDDWTPRMDAAWRVLLVELDSYV